jgi:predicted NAD/FAD-binding protein
MASAVWSTSLENIREFPARTLIQFFDNHGFLGLNTQHPWFTLAGGNSSYIPFLVEPFRERIRLGAEIQKITRCNSAVRIHFANHAPEFFDEVVLACHAPQSLSLLGDPTPVEREILCHFQTSRNEAVLHTDSSLLPQRKWARASWNYHVGAGDREVAVTYHLNRLQGLRSKCDFCLTLNHATAIAPEKILKRLTYWHPLYTTAAVDAQKRWAEISGKNHTHFCGAYWLYGFHEDGLNSALRVAGCLGVQGHQGERDGVRNLRRDAAPPPVFAGAPRVHLPAVHGPAGY